MTVPRLTPFSIVRLGACIALGSVVVVALTAAAPADRKPPACPQVIASLLPKGGSLRGGSYTLNGPMGLGSGAEDLPFTHPCIESEKFPARITVAVTYYGDDMAQLLEMQGPAANEQTLQNAMSELAHNKRTPHREKLTGGEIVFVDFTTECPAEGAAGKGTVARPPIPNVKLTGVALTANVRLEVTLEGKITLDRAKAAVSEVFANLKKLDFSKAN